ncbi:MAG TPA: hypothetical protein VFI24_13630 [Pyrinomonadaceae bacterium]|nr:hypothetical protein [Pyrinomonadaceae bacterium]
MTCRIERVLTSEGLVVLRVSGHIEDIYVVMLRELIAGENRTKVELAIDLSEVTLVGQEAIEALVVVETSGIEIRECPAYVREWISRAKEG